VHARCHQRRRSRGERRRARDRETCRTRNTTIA
jgi:hypothetical protein